MKYKGRTLKGPRTKVIPIIRDESEGGIIYFQAQGITDLDPFFKICPQPEPPKMVLPGNRTKEDTEDAGYQQELSQWFKKRTAWMVITSLRATEGLEWDKVKLNEPETWINWTDELRESGLVDSEINRIIGAVMDVNALNENVIEEARQSFLTIQGDRPNGQSFHKDDQKNTSSGEPVIKSESVPQEQKESSPGKS